MVFVTQNSQLISAAKEFIFRKLSSLTFGVQDLRSIKIYFLKQYFIVPQENKDISGTLLLCATSNYDFSPMKCLQVPGQISQICSIMFSGCQLKHLAIPTWHEIYKFLYMPVWGLLKQNNYTECHTVRFSNSSLINNHVKRPQEVFHICVVI